MNSDEQKIDNILDNFLSDDSEEKFKEKVCDDKKKFIKSDCSIIERIDRIVIAENGKQLLREVY